MIDYTPKPKKEKFQRFGCGPIPSTTKPWKPAASSIRETPAIPSRATAGHQTALKPISKYTGNAIVGVATMHKSNLVPVFSTDEAEDISHMRR